MKTFFSFFLFFTILSSRAWSESSAVQSGWTYSLQKGVVKTSRAHLLVLNPATPGERRVEVRSDCQKIKETESTYGQCKHTLQINPEGKKRTLDHGEDVFLAYFGGTNDLFPLVLGTVTYGCCAGPNIIEFFDPHGASLGRLPTFQNVAPLMDYPFDFQNVGDHRYIIVTKEDPAKLNGKSDYLVWTYLGSDKYSQEPLHLNLPTWKECIWTISGVFVPEKNILDIHFALAQCEHPSGEIKSHCAKSAGQWTCAQKK